MSPVSSFAHQVWRSLIALTFVIGVMAPSLVVQQARAQATLPRTAAAAPDATVFFEEIDLNTQGAQWQKAEELLARVGVPNALDVMRQQILSEGARSGSFSAADLDALLGGEAALIVTPPAINRLISMHMMHGQRMAESSTATPAAQGAGQPLGVAAVLFPNNPDAAWAYAQRQVKAYADKLGVQVETGKAGNADLIWTKGMAGMGDAGGRTDDPFDGFFMHHGRGAVAAGRDGDFIIAAKSQADVATIADVIDGKSPSLANSTAAQDVASKLPAASLSFSYVDLQSIVSSLDPEVLQSLQSFMPAGVPPSAWAGHVGFALSADDPGFRLDSITTFPQGTDVSKLLVDNNPSVAAQAKKVPAGSLLFEAGILPPKALAGLPYTFSQAVNGAMHMAQGPMAAIPSREEIEAEIAKATQTLGFNPATDLFNLLGPDFIVFSSFPQFGGGGFGLDAVLAISTTDATTVSQTMGKIADWVGKTLPEAKVSKREVDGGAVYDLTDPQAQGAPAIEFGVVDNQAVLAIGKGLEQLRSAPATSLADDPQYQAVLATLPSDFYQVVYFDIGRLVSLAMMMTGNMQPGAMATPGVTQGSPQNIRAFAMVGFRQDDAAGSSAILYIAKPGA
jgi:hypothetical protein